MRNSFISSILTLLCLLPSVEAHALKWKGQRQSKNVIDLRKETAMVSAQNELESGRALLIAMMMMAEKDSVELPSCTALNQEIENVKAARTKLYNLEKPVQRLTCGGKWWDTGLNLCASSLAQKSENAPPPLDLKAFEADLTSAYEPAIEQINGLSSALERRADALSKEERKCQASLLLIRKKSEEVTSAYQRLLKMVQEWNRPNP